MGDGGFGQAGQSPFNSSDNSQFVNPTNFTNNAPPASQTPPPQAASTPMAPPPQQYAGQSQAAINAQNQYYAAHGITPPQATGAQAAPPPPPQPTGPVPMSQINIPAGGLQWGGGSQQSAPLAFADGGGVGDDYNTRVPNEAAFQAWKAQTAPNDSGADYDLRGAYLANMRRDPENGHMGDRFKKPNHPTFSDQSQYAVGDQRSRAGHWVGPEGPDQTFVPPAPYADGGAALDAGGPPAGGLSGLITSPIAGRTDRLPMDVAPNSYVIPADIVSGLGQGNTLAGGRILDAMLKNGPHMQAAQASPAGGQQGFADGGATEGTTPIVTAGGEFICSPEMVAAIGGGDMDKGHKILDNMVLQVRKQTVKQIQDLPKPKK